MESILTSIKKLLGIAENNKDFDTDIVIYINTVFSDLTSIGVGPSEGFSIEDEYSIWNDFISEADAKKLNNVKTYMYLRVKLVFDPPTNSSVLTSMQTQADKLEWKLNVAVESPYSNGEEENQNGEV